MRCSRFGGKWENFRTKENQENMYKRDSMEGDLLELRKTRREKVRSEKKMRWMKITSPREFSR